MKDRLGQDLNINDKVVYAMSHYACLYIGYVDAFTPKKVYVRTHRDPSYSKPRDLVETRQVAKV